MAYALVNAVAVLIIACPVRPRAWRRRCRSWSAPAAARGRRADQERRGARESWRRSIRWSSTRPGTLTEGKPRLVASSPRPGTDEARARFAWRRASNGQASIRWPPRSSQARKRQGASHSPRPTAFESLTGKGVQGDGRGRQVAIGNLRRCSRSWASMRASSPRGRAASSRRPDGGLRRHRRPAWRAPRRRRPDQGVDAAEAVEAAPRREAPASSCSPATTGRPPRPWRGSSASMTSAPRCCPNEKGEVIKRAPGARATSWRWRATASTTPRPWRRPTSASPWAPARTSRWKAPASRWSRATCGGIVRARQLQPGHDAEHPPEPRLRLPLQLLGVPDRRGRALPVLRRSCSAR